MQQPFYARGYHDSTLLHPLAAGALVVLGIATFVLPRRWATFPLLLLACMIPSAQRVALAGLDLTLLRLMILCGWVRLLAKREWRAIRLCLPDKFLLAWAAVESLAYIALHRNVGAVVYMSARMYEGLGTYFLFRGLVRDWEGLRCVGQQLAIIAIPTGLAFLNESLTRRNVFSVFGGVPAITPIRQGRLRCFGAFDNPIVAGCFFAAAIPLIASLWWRRGGSLRPLAVTGVGFSLLVVYACASSTPVAAVAAGFLGATFFYLRYWMREIRLGLVATLVSLHIVMKAPVWHLISRIDIVGGSTGWHRFNLIDQAIRRVFEWGLIGVKSTAHWGIQLFDVTNQYVLEGVYGGLGALTFFILVLVTAYRGAGRLWRAAGRDREKVALAWGLGVMLYVHTMCFIAVSYFGQIIVSWYMVPAMIASLTETSWLGRRRAARAPAGAVRRPVRRPMPRPVRELRGSP